MQNMFLLVINMAVDQPFKKISKLKKVQLKLDQNVAKNAFPAKVLASIIFELHIKINNFEM